MPSRRSALPFWVIDLGIGIILASLAFFQLLFPDSARFTRDPDLWGVLLVFGQTVPLVVRRLYPTTVLLVVSTAFVIDRMADYPTTAAVFGVIIALHAVGAHLDHRRSARMGGTVIVALTVFTIGGMFAFESVTLATVVVFLVFMIVPLILGREVHDRRRYVARLEERTVELERDRQVQAQRAVAAERARIARELHDVVAHEMTVMTVQAGAAKRIAESRPAAARESLDTIETAGRRALREMRRLLGMLRETGDEASRIPQPGLARLDNLVEQMHEAGLPVEVHVTGEPRALPPGVDLSAYRIIQEALTNTLKHGGPRTGARVHIHYDPTDLQVIIADNGRGTGNGDAGGQGLVGMRERVAMLGGTISVGPSPGGGFAVNARLPVSSS